MTYAELKAKNAFRCHHQQALALVAFICRIMVCN